MSIFVTYFCISGAVIHKVGVGLDQKLSMPDVSIYFFSVSFNRKYLMRIAFQEIDQTKLPFFLRTTTENYLALKT